VVIVGENEIQSQQFAVRDLKTKEQVAVPRADLPRQIRSATELLPADTHNG
jgi:histidyl-tRNA synthetase